MGDVFGIGSAVSGVAQATGTVLAADKQAEAANHATDVAQQRYTQTRNDLQGYNQLGQQNTNALASELDNFGANAGNYTQQMTASLPDYTLGNTTMPTLQNNSTVPQSMTQAQLEATPGYQFTLGQGEKATQSAAAARGLGVSGAALKGAANYATGLADNTYQNQFAIQQQQFADQLNKDNQNFGQQNTLFQNQYNLGQGQFNQAQTRLGDWNNVENFNQGALQNKLNYQLSLGQIGENAGAQTGTIGASLSQSGGNQGIVGANNFGNTLTSGLNGVGGTLNNYLNGTQQGGYLNQLLGGGNNGSYGNFNGGGVSYGSYSGNGFNGSLQ